MVIHARAVTCQYGLLRCRANDRESFVSRKRVYHGGSGKVTITARTISETASRHRENAPLSPRLVFFFLRLPMLAQQISLAIGEIGRECIASSKPSIPFYRLVSLLRCTWNQSDRLTSGNQKTVSQPGSEEGVLRRFVDVHVTREYYFNIPRIAQEDHQLGSDP